MYTRTYFRHASSFTEFAGLLRKDDLGMRLMEKEKKRL